MKRILFLAFLLCCQFSLLLQAQQKALYFGNALHFDGVNDYVEINGLGALMTNIDSFTIELTVQLDMNKQQSGGHRSLFAINKSIAGGENELLIVMGNHGASRGKTLIFDDNGIGTGAFEISGNTSIGDEDGHHIAYVKAGDSAKLYVDGLWQGSHQVGCSIDNTKRFSLGQDWDRALPSDFTSGLFSKLNHNGQINTAQFHVYPNPAKSFLIIDAPSLSVNKGYEIRVLNAIGQTVYSSSIKQSQIKRDISKWGGAGIYVPELVDSGKGVHFSKKIILQ